MRACVCCFVMCLGGVVTGCGMVVLWFGGWGVLLWCRCGRSQGLEEWYLVGFSQGDDVIGFVPDVVVPEVVLAAIGA